MASAQLSSPLRAGAGSDLKETAPAPLEPCSGRSVQGEGPGGAWRLPRGTSPGWPGWDNRATPAPKPGQASLAAARAKAFHSRPLPTRGRGLFLARQA